MVKRRTRKVRARATVEGLHASFEKIDTKVRTMIHSGKTDKALACCIRKAWSEQFHTGLSESAIKGMILQYRAVHQLKRGTRKHPKQRGMDRTQRGGMDSLDRTQRGGMAPIGMPIMGQGITSQPDPAIRFPTPISESPYKAFDLQHGGISGCAPKGQAGGSLFASLANGLIPNSVPQNSLGAIGTTLQGGIPNIYTGPVQSSVATANTVPNPFDASNIHNITQLQKI